MEIDVETRNTRKVGVPERDVIHVVDFCLSAHRGRNTCGGVRKVQGVQIINCCIAYDG